MAQDNKSGSPEKGVAAKPQQNPGDEKAGSPAKTVEAQAPTQKAKGIKGEVDPFYLEKLYPDPLAIFTHLPGGLGDVKDNAIVVLDTSAMLLPYNSNSGSLTEIRRIFKQLSDAKRLVVPGRAAREFACHRIEKIVSLATLVEQKRTSLPTQIHLDISSLLGAVPEIEKFKTLVKDINAKMDECRGLLGKVAETIRAWNCNDPVSKIYQEVFTKDVFVESKASEKDILADSEKRNTHEIAPGFKDNDKPDGGVGDKIIWQSILELGATRKCPVIFVTNDFRKGDVGHFIGDKLLFARYELVEEYRRASNGKAFHATQLSTLMELFAASTEAVEDVRRGEEKQREEATSPLSRLLAKASKGLDDYSKGLDTPEAQEAASILKKMGLDSGQRRLAENLLSGDSLFSLKPSFKNLDLSFLLNSLPIAPSLSTDLSTVVEQALKKALSENQGGVSPRE